MIFITLGSQKFQFNRLLEMTDKLCESGSIQGNSVFAQIGYSDYIPKHYQYSRFLDHEHFEEVMGKADIVITHGGTGAIIGAIKREKKVIAVPRLSRYGEHVDDHQVEIIKQFENMDLICPCWDVSKLGKALLTVENTTYKKYISNTVNIINSLIEYIEEP